MLAQAAEHPAVLGIPQGAAAYGFKEEPSSSHSLILRMVGKGHGRRLLDVGAADGFLARRLSALGWEVTGIEGNPGLARQAEPHCSRVVIADLNRSLPQVERVEGSFDAIVYGDVLEHLAQPEAVFRSINCSLGPEGVVIVSVPNIAHLWIRAQLLFGRFNYADKGILDRTHLRFFTLTSFREFLRVGGVRPTEMRVSPAPLELVVPPRWLGPWLWGVQRAHALAARAWPAGLGYQLIVKGVRDG